MNQNERVVALAKSFLGTKEEGVNKGKWVEEFQKSVNGYANGEPWCLAFVQYCNNKIAAEDEVKRPLFQTEHCMTLWDKTPEAKKFIEPQVGDVVIWRKYVDQDGTTYTTLMGHAGIVSRLLDGGDYAVVEGNTSSGMRSFEREGDGVYEKIRKIDYQIRAGLVLQGFIRPWG